MAKPWSKATTKAVARRRFYQSSLEAGLDRDGVLQIKCRTMFRRELKNTLDRVVRFAQRDVASSHYRTGKLLKSIHATQIRQIHPHRIAGNVRAGGPTAPYALYIHEGSRPHIIRAKPGKYLAFTWTGRTGRKSISYPGIDMLTGDPLVYTRGPRKGQQKMYSEWAYDQPLADRDVVVKSVNHPGTPRNRFLNVAAAKAMAGEGGRINLPRG